MSIERTNVLLRPSLRFISTLPTIKIKETIVDNCTVVWKVEPPKPVCIMYEDCPVLDTFYIGAITTSSFSVDTGWEYSMKIGIKRDLGTCGFLIGIRDEDFYLNNKWWDWH